MRTFAERQFRAVCGTEKIRDERKFSTVDLREQQSRTACGDDATMNLCGFEVRVDTGRDLDEVTIVPEALDEGAEIWEGHNGRAIVTRSLGLARQQAPF